jgi:hypothetical protein
VEVCPGNQAGQEYPNHQPEFSIQRESGSQSNCGIAGQCREELWSCFAGTWLGIVI